MSGLETLSPDQRAVLQLILVQGRGYDELAATLKLDPAAVRERAHAGAEALVDGRDDVADPAMRGRVVDYLLGQQDDGERIVTFAALGDAPAACRWAQALRGQLAGVARTELPEVPGPAAAPPPSSANGSAAHSGAATAVAAPATTASPPQPALAATAPAPTAASAPSSAPAPAAAPGGAVPPSAPAEPATGGPSGPRPSRLGGAILIAGAAALAIVLAIVLIDGGSGGGSHASSTTGATTPTTAQTQTSTTPSGTTTGASRAPAARPLAAAVLRSPSGGSAIGAGIVTSSSGRRLLAVEAAKLAPNGTSDIYAIWLQGAGGNKFMGFVPNRVGSDGTFTVSASLDSSLDLASYGTLLVTREGTTAVPTTPGTVVLGGPLRAAG